MAQLKPGDKAPLFEFVDAGGTRRSFAALFGQGGGREDAGATAAGAVVLVFTRYAGCPICQLETARLGRSAAAFAAKGARLLIVTRSATGNLGTLAELAAGAMVVSDPGGDIYRLYGVKAGNLLQYAAPAVLARAKEAGAAGFVHGPREGEERQLPAAFVIGPDGLVAWARYGRHIADAASPEELLAHLP